MHEINHPPKSDIYCKWSKARSKHLFPKFDNSDFYCDSNVSFNPLKNFGKYKNSHILVLGAGPSSIDFDFASVDYDYIWACNNFFLNDKINKMDFDLIGVGNRINVKHQALNEYLESHDCYIGFELTSTPARIKELNHINDVMVKQYYDRLFWFQTKSYIGLGMGVEMIDFAVTLQPKQISFVGIDGICGVNVPHNYEPGKSDVPHNYTENLMYNRFKTWWKIPRNIKLNNLGYGNEYNLLTRIQNE